VRALTGTDPDRLPEEKARGITIDLGFAHVDLADGVVASFVDVPGHERFVRNMLAGASGIEAVVLVVAADESVMPQTREHFEICRLLGVPRGLVALTKCDAAAEDAQAVAAAEVAELVSGSFLEGAPVLRVSARTGLGLDELRAALAALARDAPRRSPGALARLPVDRVFTMKGFGTVVTGTLASGSLAVGDELEVLPSGRRARVRGIQVHGASVGAAVAGTRTALNLAGVETADVARGDLLVRPGTLQATAMLDVELSLLGDSPPLEDGDRVRVHAASAEVLARVRLLEAGPLAPGGRALAQLRLEGRTAVGRHDRLVIRSYSPATTIGGAWVVDPLPPRRRARDAAAVARLRDAAGLVEAAEGIVGEAGTAGVELPRVAARLTASVDELGAALASSREVASLGTDPPVLLGRLALDRLQAETIAALEAYHRDNPLRPAMPRQELRARLFDGARAAVFERVLGDLAAAGRARLLPEAVALAGHEVRLSDEEEQARRVLLEAAAAAGLAGIEVAALAAARRMPADLLQRVARVLVGESALVRVGTSALVARGPLDELARKVRERWPKGSKLEVGAFKDLTGLTRKHAIPLLEYLDRTRLTRRAGDDRIVI
jgi:selenocysteine-specific elongation factor